MCTGALLQATMADFSSGEEWNPEQQIQELKKRTKVLRSTLILDQVPSFKPHPDDVVVAMPPKNGTTWMLHICHQIRVQGQEPDFEDQLDVVGWIEGGKLLDVDIATQNQPAKPRIFITHLRYHLVPVGGRRIHCFRDPKDSILSDYYFQDKLISLRGRVSLSVFAQFSLEQMLKGRLNNLLVWWEHRHDENVLLIFFDDLKEDHTGCVHRIAKFINVDCDEDTIARVVHTTSHAEMLRHESKFSVHKLARVVAEKIGETPLPEGAIVTRVRKDGGKSGEGKQKLPVEVQQHIDQIWQEIVTARLGFQDLNQMRQAWKKELGTQFSKL